MISLQITWKYFLAQNLAYWSFRDIRRTHSFITTIIATMLLANQILQACIYKEPSGYTRIDIKAISLKEAIKQLHRRRSHSKYIT